MADTSAQERLQPSLLDRLVDLAPNEQRESDDKRTLTKQALRQAVLRDLSWLFNATGYGLAFDDKHHPQAARSVINYGLPMLSGQFTSSVQRVSMEQALKNAIMQFEPRILPRTLEVELVMEGPALDSHNRIGLQIRGMLWAQPVPLEFLMRSRIDLEEGRIDIEDTGHPGSR
ncbi:type VI secretion system baseplate subunit TssE [Variovorax sp. PAMC 28711]|uniref:type VI secretion system baseplate subunit TssE n=1 Tax=Variovorax sp. PAMC 28711 TaxID=1795631 RepID=UPI00078D9899|nr:type VI secretion system baseplate subunit TssE [Variovorax sp. PAMC 28711]AMM25103.1 type VI secretion system lysozyme [Variovorax sp. PAMC 28711]